jgi:potassium inwardly-rectifying channel subfamily J
MTSYLLQDLYITLIDMKWRYVILLVFAAFFVCYLVFALLYWLTCYMRGQYSHKAGDPGFKPCIKDVDGLQQAFLFSMETQCERFTIIWCLSGQTLVWSTQLVVC